MFLLLSLAIPCSAQRVTEDPLPRATPVLAKRAAGIDSMRLRPGDVVRVAVWREPTLQGDFPVDESGDVSLPMLGRRHVVASPWGVVRDSLRLAYERDLRSSSITLTPLRRLYVLGSVLRPGVYLLETTFGVAGAITMAGGATPEGDLAKIRIVRDGRNVATHISLSTTAAEYELVSGDQLFVDRRTWVDRNSALLLSSFLSLAGIIVSLTRTRI